MNRHEDIQDELKQIGPFWADLGNAIPYTLPKGYFDAFPGMVMEKIQHPFMLQSDTGNSYQYKRMDTNCTQKPATKV